MLLFHRKVSLHAMVAGMLILTALALRLVLVTMGWPTTDSDEGTIGIMALHIAYHGEHPTFFYGQNYMGSWEAFLGAGIFHLFGPSLATLRLGTVCMFALFLISLYLLSKQLFSHTWALITLLLVGTGSAYLIATEIKAIGGYVETLFFCTLLFLCATWLVLTSQPVYTRRVQVQRWGGYLLWGLTAGLGLWTDLLIVPAVLVSGLLLLVGWRELLKLLPLLCLLLGLGAGAFPLIYYNMHAPPGYDSLSVIRSIAAGSGSKIYTPDALLREVSNTFQVSLPLITGEPFCSTTEIGSSGSGGQHVLACIVAPDAWSASYLLLFVIACLLTVRRIWSLWRWGEQREDTPGRQNDLRKAIVCLALLLSTALSLVLYTFSHAPLSRSDSATHAHYLICLLVAIPVVFWPVWQGLQKVKAPSGFPLKVIQMLCRFGLCCFCFLSLLGSVFLWGDISAARALNQNDAALITTLEQRGINHIYTDYWTCDRIAFESDERIICAVLTFTVQVDNHYNRYVSYITRVKADPHAAYILPIGQSTFTSPSSHVPLNDPKQPLLTLPARFRVNYIRIVAYDYVMYVPR